MQLNSVIFHTKQLSQLRLFYEEKLNLPTGTYVKENVTLPDFSESYVNYHIGGGLLCFEFDENKTDLGTVVLNVDHFSEFKKKVEKVGIQIVKENDHYFKINDPDGRTLIIEPLRP